MTAMQARLDSSRRGEFDWLTSDLTRAGLQKWFAEKQA
jgi:hypothetical protein